MQQIIGRLIEILPVVTGETQRGQWQRGGFVIGVGNEYPKKVAFTTFGEDITIVTADMLNRTVQVTYRPESREFNGRWYTDLKATRAGVFQATQQGVPAQAPVTQQTAIPTDNEFDF